MSIRHPAKAALGLVLAIAILAAPGVASAQSLFDAPAPDTSSSPASSTPPAAPATAPAKAKKPVAKMAQSPVAAPDTSSSTPTAAAPAKSKKPIAKKTAMKPAVPKTVAKVNVINDRDATLVELSVISTTAKDATPQIVARDLKSGQKISAPLAKNGGCIYDVSGNFDDQSTVEQSAVDFCKDANLDLVE
jgi:hypothetical protein